MVPSVMLVTLSLWAILGLSHCTLAFTHEAKTEDYVRDACRVTRYPTLCIRSLAAFSGEARRSPYGWARAAVSVTLKEAERVSQYLIGLKPNGGQVRGKAQFALSDCMELLGDTLDQLHNSLFQLRRLNSKAFEEQIGNVETWVSAALTYENTCLDGLSGVKRTNVKVLEGRVENVSRFTSNALALVNKLASTGAAHLDSP